MSKLKNFALSYPLIFGLVLVAVYPLLAILTYPVRFLFPQNQIGLLYSDTISKLILFSFFFVILWRFGWIRASGISRLVDVRIWMFVAIIFIYHVIVDLYVITGEVSIVSSNSPLAFPSLLYYFPASLMEEIVFRGLILLAMVFAWGSNKTGIVKAVVFSSLYFGLIHLFNLAEQPVGVVLFQAVGAALLGILWAAIVLVTKSLWPVIIIHWLTNAAVNIKLIENVNFQATAEMYGLLAIFFIPMAVLGTYLVWKLPVLSREIGSPSYATAD